MEDRRATPPGQPYLRLVKVRAVGGPRPGLVGEVSRYHLGPAR